MTATAQTSESPSGTFAGARQAPNASTVSEWLESPHLPGIIRRIALRHGVWPQDLPDLIQEVDISLIRKGLESQVNATWIFKVIASNIVNYLRKSHLRESQPRDQEIAAFQATDPELYLLVESTASRLRGRLRTFYFLRYRLGLRQREVALRLGVTRAAVRHLEQKLLARLRGGKSLPRQHHLGG